MFNRIAPGLAVLLTFACTPQPQITETFGEKISLQEQTRISKILMKPGDFVGQRVLIRGEVLEVCPSKGCWIEVESDAPDEQIQVKVEDDIIVFPQSLKGKIVLVEGIVEELQLTKEQALAMKNIKPRSTARSSTPPLR